MFGPREQLLTSDEPVVRQFLNGRMLGPIGMSEEKDSATMAAEQAMVDAGHHPGGVEDIQGVPPQMRPSPGIPARKGEQRRKDRVMKMLHTFPDQAQRSIVASLSNEERDRYGVSEREFAAGTWGDTAEHPTEQQGTVSGQLPEN